MSKSGVTYMAWKRVIKPLLFGGLLFIMLMATVGVVNAINSWLTLSADMTVVDGSPAFQAFVDAEATFPYIAPIHFGNVPAGSRLTQNFYIKNNGTSSANISMRISDNVSYFMTYSFTPNSPMEISPGQIQLFTWTADILSSAARGIKPFTFDVYSP